MSVGLCRKDQKSLSVYLRVFSSREIGFHYQIYQQYLTFPIPVPNLFDQLIEIFRDWGWINMNFTVIPEISGAAACM